MPRNSLGEVSRSFRSGACEAPSFGFCPFVRRAFVVEVKPAINASAKIRHAAVLNFRFDISVISLFSGLSGLRLKYKDSLQAHEVANHYQSSRALSCKFLSWLVLA